MELKRVQMQMVITASDSESEYLTPQARNIA